MKQVCENCHWFIGWKEIEGRLYGYCTFTDEWVEEETAMNENLKCDCFVDNVDDDD